MRDNLLIIKEKHSMQDESTLNKSKELKSDLY